MRWSITIGSALIGSFVIYLLAENRLDIYLGLFTGSAAAQQRSNAMSVGGLISGFGNSQAGMSPGLAQGMAGFGVPPL